MGWKKRKRPQMGLVGGFGEVAALGGFVGGFPSPTAAIAPAVSIRIIGATLTNVFIPRAHATSPAGTGALPCPRGRRRRLRPLRQPRPRGIIASWLRPVRRGDEPIGHVRKPLDAAEIGAIAHLYRGEVYRSTIWRTRLDTTTNWAVVTLGVALSISFAAPGASPLPLVLVGILIIFFLVLEARRYRYFNVWRARCRWLERHFYAPLLSEGDLHLEENWHETLAEDYLHPHYHVSYMTAVGRRIRHNYLWILLIQSLAYAGKLVVHPTPVQSFDEAMRRADVGPLAGEAMVVIGVLYVTSWSAIAVWSYLTDGRRARARGASSAASMG